MGSILNDFSATTVARANEANLCDVYRLLRHSPQIHIEDGANLLRVDCVVPHPLVNRVLWARLSAEDRDAQIAETLNYYRTRNLPISWIVGPSSHPDDLSDHLQAHGCTFQGNMRGMAVALSALPDELPQPRGFAVLEAMDDSALTHCIEVGSIGFDVDLEVVEVFRPAIVHGGFGAHAPIRCFVAYLEGKPVACSALFLGAGVAGIYNVATVPEARRQGIGALITAYPLRIARQLGYQIGILQASEMGYPVYQRLGFQECCQFPMYGSELQ